MEPISHRGKSSLFALTHGAGRLKARANGEGKMLPGAHALLPGDDDARDKAEPHLGDDKPWPANPFREHRVQKFHNAMNQARPHDWRDHTSQQNGAARKHRKHCAIEKPDQKRCDEMDDGGDDQKDRLKGAKLLPWYFPLPEKIRPPAG